MNARKVSSRIRWTWSFGVLAAVALSGQTAWGQTKSLDVRGIELLPQSVAPQGAVFAFSLFERGRTVGAGLVQVDHGNVLPVGEGNCVPVLGGSFAFTYKLSFVSGEIIGGEICATANPDLYVIELQTLTDDGVPLCFDGTLDHSPLRRRPPRPPVIQGTLSVCQP